MGDLECTGRFGAAAARPEWGLQTWMIAVIFPERAILALGGLLLAAALLGAVPPKPETLAAHSSFAGQLLIASPQMRDPRFRETVILLIRHNKDGAFGIAINRPIGKYPLATLLNSFGEKDTGVSGSVQVFAGGPVQPGAAFVIHSPEYSRSETIAVNGLVAATSSREVFRDIGQNKGPGKTLIAFGYAGWGPNQLEAEMARNDWFTAIADPALIFDESRERLWDAAMERRLRDL
jgi:putative transcriptional regulator